MPPIIILLRAVSIRGNIPISGSRPKSNPGIQRLTLFGFKGNFREPQTEKKGNEGLLWVLGIQDSLSTRHSKKQTHSSVSTLFLSF